MVVGGGGCSALDEGFIKDHEKLRGEMKEPRVGGSLVGRKDAKCDSGKKISFL